MKAKLREAIAATSVTLTDFQQLMGKLNHATIGMPNGRGLSAPIYQAMKGDPANIPITANLKHALSDWHTMIEQISARPTHVLELSPGEPAFIGYVDACKTGVGGVWLSGTQSIKPRVWRFKWPADISNNLVS